VQKLTDLAPTIYDGIIDEMAAYFAASDWQTRTRLQPDDRLMAVAQYRADDMALNDYISHKDQDGVWPNQHVRDAGYRLPDWYESGANFVESVAYGFGSAVNALDALAASPDHKAHATGAGFWEDHLRYGVGFAWVDDRRVYVLITAPVETEIQPSDDKYWTYLPYIGKGVRSA
jgi:hypothetical protein